MKHAAELLKKLSLDQLFNHGKDRNDRDFALSCPLDHGLVPFYGKKCIETDKYFKYINLI